MWRHTHGRRIAGENRYGAVDDAVVCPADCLRQESHATMRLNCGVWRNEMTRLSALIIVLVATGASAVQAQNANPISTNLKQDWSNISNLLAKMADRMPDDGYRFKPTPEMQDFGQRMAHVIGFNMRNCAMLRGDQKSVMFSPSPTKAEIVAAVKQTNDECDSLFNSLTDADLQKMVATRGGQRLELSVIEGNLLEHSQEMYGYMAVYLRLKGVVPPSSDRNEH